MGDIMSFPKNYEDFIKEYAFIDSKEYYTNGAELISTYRVQQMIKHYFISDIDNWKTKQLYDGDGNPVYIHLHAACGYEIHGYKHNGTPYCPNCGRKMKGPWNEFNV